MTQKIRNFDQMPSLARLPWRLIKTFFRKGVDEALPTDIFQLKNIEIDAQHLAAYQKVCGFERSDQLPLTYLHVLAFKLQIEMLLDDGCDFPLLGLVHIDNEITRHKPLSAGDRYELQCRFGPLENHRKGKLITLLLEAYVDGELVLEGRATNLCRMANPEFDASATPSIASLSVERRPLNNEAERWKLGANLGRRYAKVSGDRNPIHLWKSTAKLLGFKRQIIHGMWSKARLCAAIEPQLGDGPVRVRTEFKQPIFLPGKVHFYQAETANGCRVEIWDTQASRVHLVGIFEQL